MPLPIELDISPGYVQFTRFEDRVPDYVLPQHFGGSEELTQELEAWGLEVTEEMYRAYCVPLEYEIRGWTLARRLARELGPSPVVTWCRVPALDAERPRSRSSGPPRRRRR